MISISLGERCLLCSDGFISLLHEVNDFGKSKIYEHFQVKNNTNMPALQSTSALALKFLQDVLAPSYNCHLHSVVHIILLAIEHETDLLNDRLHTEPGYNMTSETPTLYRRSTFTSENTRTAEYHKLFAVSDVDMTNVMEILTRTFLSNPKSQSSPACRW
jgi:hypothetical protein